jgi:hypothetical protein
MYTASKIDPWHGMTVSRLVELAFIFVDLPRLCRYLHWVEDGFSRRSVTKDVVMIAIHTDTQAKDVTPRSQRGTPQSHYAALTTWALRHATPQHTVKSFLYLPSVSVFRLAEKVGYHKYTSIWSSKKVSIIRHTESFLRHRWLVHQHGHAQESWG